MSEDKNSKLPLRAQVWILLVGFAALALIMPDRHRSASELKPSEMIHRMNRSGRTLSPDQVARYVISEDTSILLIDIREPEAYLASHIPGAVNIPLRDILNPDWAGYLDDPEVTVVLYSNGDLLASEAWMMCVQKGTPDPKVMKGGMNGWFETIMESEFSGGRISAAENALFEVRYRARDFFTQMNSLPDSLKTAFLEIKRKKEAELTGGCE
jgi:rhodanese-related sulfurtransferase